MDAMASVSARVSRRWQTADPLLPAPGPAPPGCGARFVVTGPGGRPVAAGTCEHWQGSPGSLETAWGAARRFSLTARVAGLEAAAGLEVAAGLDELIGRWRGHLARVPGTDDGDSAALVAWPSRDVGGAAALLRRGFSPLAVIAARAHDHGTAGGLPGLTVRRAGPADLDAVVRLGLETIRYDAHFGCVIERPWTAEALRREAAGLLAGQRPWTWLAERDRTAVGMLTVERPEAAAWIAPMVGRSPAAYLLLASVLPSDRGGGVGTALAARAHREIDTAGVAVTLLHYAQTNPLSAPFWSRQGYRPLWTDWEARPASAIR